MKQFEMSETQHKQLLEASKPTPVMFLSGGKSMFRSQQQNANDAWRKLGAEMGFDWDTVKACGQGERSFMAEGTNEEDGEIRIELIQASPEEEI